MSGFHTFDFLSILHLLALVLIPIVGLLCITCGIPWLLRKREDGDRMLMRNKSTKFFLLAPGLLNLALFYSLAIHMYQSLGGWPETIGNEGFPAALDLHDAISSTYFGCLFLFIWALPLLSILFAKIESLKCWLAPLVAAGVSAVLSIVLTAGLPFLVMPLHLHIAPAEFIYWWWD